MGINFKVVNAALDPATLVPMWLPDGKKINNEWVATNPTRGDKHAGSFSVNLLTGVWCDFAGDPKIDRGGDIVGLYAYLFHNRNQVEAARELMRDHRIVDNAEARERVSKPSNVESLDNAKPVPVMPVPEGAPLAPSESWSSGFRHPKFGMPSRTWAYRDVKGRLLFYIARYDVEPRKQIVPWSWCKDPKAGKESWRPRGISGSAKRPLYGLEKLAEYPDHDVLLVEGEKAADAAQEILGDACIVLSWMGGVPAADKVSVAPLKDRRVFMWPDFDAERVKLTPDEADAGIDPQSKPYLPLHEQPGLRAMMAIAGNLKGITADANILMVGYQVGEKPHGWDLADAQAEGWTGETVLQWLGARARDPRLVATGAPVQAPVVPAAAPAGNGRKLTPLDCPVNVFGFPDMGDKNAPLDTIENMQYMLEEYGITARYNVISKEVEISIPGKTFSQDNHMESCLSHIGSVCGRNRMPRGNVAGYITTIADGNQYNPAAEWIDSKPWDGKDRIDALADTLDAADVDLCRVLMRRWLVGAVACVYSYDGWSMQGVLVLQGAQGLGKTTWIKHLADFNHRLVAESVILNPADKDSVKQFASYWLVELGELEATFSKSDITALRGFITKQMDELRLPYAKATSKFPRRTAAAASVNEHAYLRDETGNRRYWTIRCGDGLNAMHDIDMQQVWAQAKVLYEAGERHPLTKDEMARLEEANMEHTERNPLEDLIMSRFEWDKLAVGGMTAAEVCIAVGYDKPTNKQAKDAATILRRATGGEPKKSNGRVVFQMPPLRYKREQFTEDDDGRPF
ncbi:TPA: hypothetical protein QDB21_005616 [Burkholderia vietnamiensis]|nr:hypothetical protein [Burkholderia vietnamiensis]